MFSKLAKLFGGSDEKVIAKIRPRVNEINALESEFERMSDDDLQIETQNLRRAASGGEGLDALLPRAFAAIREAAKRALGQRHYDVQLIGGVVLHQGKIAEMKTGEGKTLVATLPAYLNSLSGRGVHVVTVNDYLARRDAHWMGAVYDALGVSVGALQNQSALIYDPFYEDGERGFERMRPATRAEAYAADITYGTNNEFGFDYLRDNMSPSRDDRVQRERAYAIVDEVDNILIDEARTPLIISGPSNTSARDYLRYAKLAPTLAPEEDYTLDEKHKTAALTQDGITKLERALNVPVLYDDFEKVHHIENALKAQVIFEKNRDYVVQNREVVIVDEFTGRLMTGRRYSDGLHQAIEAKEGVPILPESVTYATITLQNYFRLYEKLSGMTGTAATEAEEFDKIYKLEVVAIPTNRPMIREDMPDLIYKDEEAKFRAVAREIEERSRAGQPVLVGTTDIDKSEKLGAILRRGGIAHEVLNAKQHEREALIVAQAGRPGAVTVATNMAGRGTDIVLGGSPDLDGVSPAEWEESHKRVLDAGGLHIIGTERHEARRIDNQLRGRAGRQGDPGSTQFYVALDDDVIRRFGGDRIRSVMDWAGMEEDVPISNSVVSKAVENSQVKVEAYHFDMRKHLVEYDDVVNTHRDVIYGEREKILSGADLKANVRDMLARRIGDMVAEYIGDRRPDDWDLDGLTMEMATVMPPPPEWAEVYELADGMNAAKVEDMLAEHAHKLHEDFEGAFGQDNMRAVERDVMLVSVDANWVQHLTAMENLRQGIGLYAYGQRDPLVMYKKEGMDQFQALQNRIRGDVARQIFRNGMRLLAMDANGRGQNGSGMGAPPPSRAVSPPRARRSEMASVAARSAASGGGGGGDSRPQRRTSRKVGRNQPCPCGSGRKYKRCCAA